MAKAKSQISTGRFRRNPTRKRPGVHSKKRNSKIKGTKLYVKRYKGQGR